MNDRGIVEGEERHGSRDCAPPKPLRGVDEAHEQYNEGGSERRRCRGPGPECALIEVQHPNSPVKRIDEQEIQGGLDADGKHRQEDACMHDAADIETTVSSDVTGR